MLQLKEQMRSRLEQMQAAAAAADAATAWMNRTVPLADRTGGSKEEVGIKSMQLPSGQTSTDCTSCRRLLPLLEL